jgi:hypothetical protein
MKRIPVLILIAVLLAGCGVIGKAVPTPDDSMIATQVAQILTTNPTAAPVESSATPALPTIVQPTQASTETETLPADTATSEPPTATETPVSSATATSTPPPTSTIAFTPVPGDPANSLGTPTWVDDMNNGDNWPVGTDKYTSIDFSGGTMKLEGLTTTDGWRLTTPLMTNFYLEVTFKTSTCTGDDRYGVIVRVPDSLNPDRGYLLGFTCDGQYSLRRWNAEVGAKGEMVNLIGWTASDAIKSGQNQTNRMGLMAVGNRLIVYANGQMLKEADDNTFQQGYFGVFVGARETTDFTVQVDQARYWDNPTP